jgi:hypothetical protein
MIARACSGKYMVQLTTTIASMRSGCNVAMCKKNIAAHADADGAPALDA